MCASAYIIITRIFKTWGIKQAYSFVGGQLRGQVNIRGSKKKGKHDLDSSMPFQITMWGVTIVPSQVALSALQIF